MGNKEINIPSRFENSGSDRIEKTEKFKQDQYKFEQVFLYVLSKVGGKPNIGETVLHKLMYFIDFDNFENYGESITGVAYKKNHHGPTFDLSLINNLKNENLITPVENDYLGFKQKKYLPNVEADLSVLSAQEIKHIDEVLAKHSNKTAA